MTTIIEKLNTLRQQLGQPLTEGLTDAVIERFAAKDPQLMQAVDRAVGIIECWRSAYPELLDQDEEAIKNTLQADYVNFYAEDAVKPYVALAAQGPWIITIKGRVLHDSGGYGMLGFGHAQSV